MRGLYLGGVTRNRPQDRRGEVETLLEEGNIMNYQWLALPTFKSDLKSALLGAPRFWRLFGVFESGASIGFSSDDETDATSTSGRSILV